MVEQVLAHMHPAGENGKKGVPPNHLRWTMNTQDEKRDYINSFMFRYKDFSAEAKGVLGTLFLSLLCLLLVGFVVKFM